MHSHSSSRNMLASVGLTVAFGGNTSALLVPVLPLIQKDLGTDATGITWALTIWLLAAAVATPLLGRLGDIVGRRRVILLALAIVVVGCMISMVAPNLRVLLVGQMLQGVGAAIPPLAFVLVCDRLPPSRVPAGIGVMTALTSAGGVLGTIIAGPLAELVGWRGAFALPFIGISIGAALVLRAVPESTERSEGRINLFAAIILSGWLVAFLVPLSEGSAWGWTSVPVTGLFLLAAILFAAWIIVELRSPEPLVDMRMMRLPGVWGPNLVALLIGATMTGLWAFLARFLQEPSSTGFGLGASVSQAGLAVAPLPAFLSLAGFLVGPLGRFAGPTAQLVGSTLLAALAALSVALFHGNIWILAAEAAVFGFGIGVAYAAMTFVITQSVPVSQIGVATGMNTNFLAIGNAIGATLMSAIIAGLTNPGGMPTQDGYITGFFVLTAIEAVAVIVAMREYFRPRPVIKDAVGQLSSQGHVMSPLKAR